MAQVSLSDAPVGCPLHIAEIEGGRLMRRRLATMGLREGCRIQLAQAFSSGPAVVEVGHGRLVLGAGMANKIQVAAA